MSDCLRIDVCVICSPRLLGLYACLCALYIEPVSRGAAVAWLVFVAAGDLSN